MIDLAFNSEIMHFIADHRSEPLTWIFRFFTFLGEVEGYVLVIAIIYTTYDKHLAFRLSVLVLATMCLNHLLKTIIANPRPFVNEGSYAEKWVASPSKARELVTEFSTPSGHAMSGLTFYGLLQSALKNKYAKVLIVITIILIGLSRPYLGVHYVEDILLGWAIGFAVFLVAINYVEKFTAIWNSFSYRKQIMIVVAGCAILWMVTLLMSGGNIGNLPLPFVGYLGFLTGIVIAYPMEVKKVNFDSKSCSLLFKLMRCITMIFLVALTLLLVDFVVDEITGKAAFLAHFIQYTGYIAIAVVGMYVTPLLFVKTGLGKTVSH